MPDNIKHIAAAPAVPEEKVDCEQHDAKDEKTAAAPSKQNDVGLLAQLLNHIRKHAPELEGHVSQQELIVLVKAGLPPHAMNPMGFIEHLRTSLPITPDFNPPGRRTYTGTGADEGVIEEFGRIDLGAGRCLVQLNGHWLDTLAEAWRESLPEAAQMFGPESDAGDGSFSDPECVRTIFSQAVQHWDEPAPQVCSWAILDRGEFVGNILAQRVETRGNGDHIMFSNKSGRWVVTQVYNVGFFVRRSAEGKGHATAAATAVMQWLFERELATKVVMDHIDSNLASGAVLKKLLVMHRGCQLGDEVVEGVTIRNYAFTP